MGGGRPPKSFGERSSDRLVGGRHESFVTTAEGPGFRSHDTCGSGVAPNHFTAEHASPCWRSAFPSDAQIRRRPGPSPRSQSSGSRAATMSLQQTVLATSDAAEIGSIDRAARADSTIVLSMVQRFFAR